MSIQVYESIFTLSGPMNAGQYEEFTRLPLDEHCDVIVIPQSEYNSLLEWIQKEIDYNQALEDCLDNGHIVSRARISLLMEVKEKLTTNTK